MHTTLLTLALTAALTVSHTVTAQQVPSFPLNTNCVHTAQQWLQNTLTYPDSGSLQLGNVTYTNQYVTAFLYNDVVQGQTYGADIRFTLGGETAAALLNNASGATSNSTLINFAQSLLTAFPPYSTSAPPTDAGQLAELRGAITQLQAYNNGTAGVPACPHQAFATVSPPVNVTLPYCTYNTSYFMAYNQTLPSVTVANVTYDDTSIRALYTTSMSTSSAAANQELQLAAQVITVLLNKQIGNVNLTYINSTLIASLSFLTVYPVAQNVKLYGVDADAAANYTAQLAAFSNAATSCVKPTTPPVPTTYNTTLSNTVIANATLANTTIFDTTLTNSTLVNVTLINSTLYNDTLYNDTLINSTYTNSTITNYTVAPTNLSALIQVPNAATSAPYPTAVPTTIAPTTVIPTTVLQTTVLPTIASAGNCPLLTTVSNNSYVFPQSPNQLNTSHTCTLTFNQWVVAYPNWPVLQLTLGSRTFNSTELFSILTQALGAGSTDPTITIAAQVIAAELSIAAGSNAALIQPALAITQAVFISYPVGFNYSGNTVAVISGAQALCVEAAANQIALFLNENDCSTNIPVDVGVYNGTGSIPTVNGITNIPNITSYYPLTIAGVVYQLNGTIIKPTTYGPVLQNVTSTNTTLHGVLSGNGTNSTSAPATVAPTTIAPTHNQNGTTILAPKTSVQTGYVPFNIPNQISLQPAATSASLQCALTAQNITQEICYVVDPHRSEAPWHNSNEAYPQCYDPASFVCTSTSLLCGLEAPYPCGDACYSPADYCCDINPTDFFQSTLVGVGNAGCYPYNNASALVVATPSPAPTTVVPTTVLQTTPPVSKNGTYAPSATPGPTTAMPTTIAPTTPAPTVPDYPEAQTFAPQPAGSNTLIGSSVTSAPAKSTRALDRLAAWLKTTL